MKFVVRLFNCEMGFFVKKRFNFFDLFKKDEFDKSINSLYCGVDKKKWRLEFDVEKRIQAITGFNFENKKVEETGTCLLKWLFRDVHSNVLYNPKYFDAVLDVPLENTENWREVLLKNGANNKQIQVFNVCAGNKLRFSMKKIASENYDLFINIMYHYENDSEFKLLINSIGDLE